jgi:hypothetical protein
MDKKLLKIHELESGKLYDMVNNPHPNYLLYFVDEEGFFYQRDTVVKTEGKSFLRYNDAIKMEFYEV